MDTSIAHNLLDQAKAALASAEGQASTATTNLVAARKALYAAIIEDAKAQSFVAMVKANVRTAEIAAGVYVSPMSKYVPWAVAGVGVFALAAAAFIHYVL